MKSLKLFFSSSMWLLSFSAMAQEGQLTQFFNSTLYINPAEAGADTNARITSNYRKQWTTISNGFTTKSINGDMQLGRFGYGLIVNTNDAGAGSLSRSNFLLNVADHIQLDKHNVLGFGIQAGFVQYSVNASQLKFDNQYSSGTGYDPNANNGERLSATSQTKLDGGAGLNWQNTAYSWKPKISVAVNHLLHPNYSLLENSSPTSARQLNSYLEVRKFVSNKVEIIPYVFYGKQKKASNLQFGSRVDYHLNPDQQLLLGAGVRNKDALMLYAGFSLKKVLFGFSYDVNTSKLKPGSAGMGAWEVGLTIHFGKKGKKKQKDIEELPDGDAFMEVKPEQALEEVKKDTLVDAIAEAENEKVNLDAAKNKSEAPKVDDNSDAAQKTIEYSSLNAKQIKDRYILYFDTDKSVLKPEYQAVLNKLVDDLKDIKSFQILLNGHTDSDGDGLYNIYLGDSRAHEAMKYLVEKGVHIDTMKTFTYGKHSPQAENTTTESKAQNRRILCLGGN